MAGIPEGKERDWDPGKKAMEAEMGGMQPQAKEGQGAPKCGRGKDGLSLGPSGGSVATLTL